MTIYQITSGGGIFLTHNVHVATHVKSSPCMKNKFFIKNQNITLKTDEILERLAQYILCKGIVCQLLLLVTKYTLKL